MSGKLSCTVLRRGKGSNPFTLVDFTCPAYKDLVKSKETIRISMNGKGRATDNAITERFSRNLKQEELYREEIYNGRDAYRHTDKYIRNYDWERGHQSLEYRTPSQLYMKLDDVLIAVQEVGIRELPMASAVSLSEDI